MVVGVRWSGLSSGLSPLLLFRDSTGPVTLRGYSRRAWGPFRDSTGPVALRGQSRWVWGPSGRYRRCGPCDRTRVSADRATRGRSPLSMSTPCSSRGKCSQVYRWNVPVSVKCPRRIFSVPAGLRRPDSRHALRAWLVREDTEGCVLVTSHLGTGATGRVPGRLRSVRCRRSRKCRRPRCARPTSVKGFRSSPKTLLS